MIGNIRRLFSVGTGQTDDSEATLHLAAAVLLIEVAKCDDEFDDKELLRLRATLQRDWRVNSGDLDGLVEFAHHLSDAGASLQEHIDLINGNFSSAHKLDLIRSLWQTAAADGRIHHKEELMIRRLAGLLDVSDAELVRARDWALGS